MGTDTVRRPLVPSGSYESRGTSTSTTTLLDRCVPATAQRVLNVGCGDGFLAARLSRRVGEVIAHSRLPGY